MNYHDRAYDRPLCFVDFSGDSCSTWRCRRSRHRTRHESMVPSPLSILCGSRLLPESEGARANAIQRLSHSLWHISSFEPFGKQSTPEGISSCWDNTRNRSNPFRFPTITHGDRVSNVAVDLRYRVTAGCTKPRLAAREARQLNPRGKYKGL